MRYRCSFSPCFPIFTKFPRAFSTTPPPAELLAAAAHGEPRPHHPTSRHRAHQSRPASLVLTPRCPAAAWPDRRQDELRHRLPCFVPPLGRHLGARVRGPHREAAAAPPHATACVAGLGKLPLPLTSGARWLGGS